MSKFPSLTNEHPTGLRPPRPRTGPSRARPRGAVEGRGEAAGQRSLALPNMVGLGRREGPRAAHRQEDEDPGKQRLYRARWVSIDVGLYLRETDTESQV